MLVRTDTFALAWITDKRGRSKEPNREGRGVEGDYMYVEQNLLAHIVARTSAPTEWASLLSRTDACTVVKDILGRWLSFVRLDHDAYSPEVQPTLRESGSQE